VPATAAAAAAKRIAALGGKKNAGAKLATMDDPDAVLNLNPSVAFPPTTQAGNQWDAQPVPKVLDCGPLSNNCNTKQGGEYFAHHKGDKTAAGGKKGAHPPSTLPPKSIKAAAAARFAMLAKQRAGGASARIFGATPLLKHTTGAQEAKQMRALEGTASGKSASDTYLKDLAALHVKRQRQQQLQQVQDESDELESAGKTILAAGDKLDDMQSSLNHRREAIFAEYVGPLALMKGSAPLAVTVDRFAGEWVPPGGLKVPSMLKATKLSADAAPPAAAFKAREASSLRQPAVGMEGLSLERALEGLNAEQIALNKERAALFQAAVGAGALSSAVVMNESPALLQWQGSGAATATAASLDAPRPAARAMQQPAAATQSVPVAESRLQPEVNPAVDYMGRQMVGGSEAHAPAVASPPRGGKRHESKWADERPTVHHENPRNKVADLMKELDVGGISAEPSHTRDPYDPWKPDSAATMAKATATALRAHAPVLHVPAAPREGVTSDRYETATKVFRAASAAYKAAATTWKDLEAKEAQANKLQAQFDMQHHFTKPAATTPAAAPVVAPATAQLPTATPTATATAIATPQAARAQQQRARVARTAAAKAPAPPKAAAPAHDKNAKKKGLDQYKATDAHSDLDSFFDSLIAQRVAVGHDRFNAPQRPVQKAVSARDAERDKEDALLQASDLHRVSAKELEEAEEQATKDGEVHGFVGSEFPKKTAEDSRKELNHFYDSMPGGKTN